MADETDSRPGMGTGAAKVSEQCEKDKGHNTPPRYSFAELLGILGHATDHHHDQVSLCWQLPAGQFHAELVSSDAAPSFVDSLTADGARPGVNIWFGVNPLNGNVTKGRGAAKDVTRLTSLFADLDVKPGGCPDLATAHGMIDDAEVVLGERPVATLDLYADLFDDDLEAVATALDKTSRRCPMDECSKTASGPSNRYFHKPSTP